MTCTLSRRVCSTIKHVGMCGTGEFLHSYRVKYLSKVVGCVCTMVLPWYTWVLPSVVVLLVPG